MSDWRKTRVTEAHSVSWFIERLMGLISDQMAQVSEYQQALTRIQEAAQHTLTTADPDKLQQSIVRAAGLDVGLSDEEGIENRPLHSATQLLIDSVFEENFNVRTLTQLLNLINPQRVLQKSELLLELEKFAAGYDAVHGVYQDELFRKLLQGESDAVFTDGVRVGVFWDRHTRTYFISYVANQNDAEATRERLLAAGLNNSDPNSGAFYYTQGGIRYGFNVIEEAIDFCNEKGFIVVRRFGDMVI